jgi:hypothetical protein
MAHTTADAFLESDSKITVHNMETGDGWFAWIRIDSDLSLHLMGSDAERIAACNLLTAALDEVRTAAMERIRADELAAIAEASGPGEREVVAEWTRVTA